MIKRFDPVLDSSDCYQGMEECADGDWVSIDDHEAIVKELEAIAKKSGAWVCASGHWVYYNDIVEYFDEAIHITVKQKAMDIEPSLRKFYHKKVEVHKILKERK